MKMKRVSKRLFVMLSSLIRSMVCARLPFVWYATGVACSYRVNVLLWIQVMDRNATISER